MKKYILFLSILFICNILHSQINGTVKWEQRVDFSVQLSSEYAELITGYNYYTEEVGSPKIPYCVKSFVLPSHAEISDLHLTLTNRKLIGNTLLLPT